MATHETLGLILVRNGAISRPQLYDALRLQRQNGRLLGTCLIELGYLEAERLLGFLSNQLKIPICRATDLKNPTRSAVDRLDSATARALLAIPFRWDGQSLALAVANGAILPKIPELAMNTRCDIQPYAALEIDIENGLSTIYGPAPAPTQPPARFSFAPPRSDAAGPSTDELLPEHLVSLPRVLPRTVRPPSEPPLERLGLYDAVEKVYEARSVVEIGRCLGRALLNYFSRVVVLQAGDRSLRVVGHAGVTPQFSMVPLADIDRVFAPPLAARLLYGELSEITGAEGLAGALRIGRAGAAFIATVGQQLLLYADNDDAPERYEELHDLEMVCKEGETAIGLLTDG